MVNVKPANSVLLALAQLNLTVGDITGNSNKIIGVSKHAYKKLGADILAVPEQAIIGYPAEDLILQPEVTSLCQQALQRIATEIPPELCLIVGYPRQNNESNNEDDYNKIDIGGNRSNEEVVDKFPVNSVTNHLEVLQGGKSIASYAKQQLPTYQVFDEHRLFTAGNTSCCFTFKGINFGLVICEDLWQNAPVAKCCATGAQHIISINASPYSIFQPQKRFDIVAQRASENSVSISYVNCCGGQDELVFDGHSFACDATGKIIPLAGAVTEEISLIRIEADDCKPATIASAGSNLIQAGALNRQREGEGEERYRNYSLLPEMNPQTLPSTATEEKTAEIYTMLKHGLRDYAHKNNFSHCIIGLSGGIDSALAACIASDAMGAENVTCLAMPSKHTAAMSNEDAASLAHNLGINYQTIPIELLMDAAQKSLSPFIDISDPTSIVTQNLQPRLRAIILMALANEKNALLIATSNKSESSVGYSTLYGDMAGGFAPLKDVFKNLVYELAKHRNQVQAVIPTRIIQRPPSAELYEGQQDADNLPDYKVLDEILKLYIEEGAEHDAITKHGHASSLVTKIINMVDAAEYKRRQMAPGTRISEHGFGKDRRYPITNKFSKMRGHK